MFIYCLFVISVLIKKHKNFCHVICSIFGVWLVTGSAHRNVSDMHNLQANGVIPIVHVQDSSDQKSLCLDTTVWHTQFLPWHDSDQDILCLETTVWPRYFVPWNDSVAKIFCALTRQCDQDNLCLDMTLTKVFCALTALTKTGDLKLSLAKYFHCFMYHYEVRQQSDLFRPCRSLGPVFLPVVFMLGISSLFVGKQ
jgi:hypothetical protein